MRPTQPDPREPDDLFRARLSQQINRRHPLVRLAGLIDWRVFEDRFGELYHPHVGRPGIPIRLMIGLSYLQHTFRLSDEEVVARWVENPYWQYFCGFDHLQLALPIDPSSGALAAADRPGRHRAPAAGDHRRRPAERGGQTAEPRAGQHRHHGAAQSDRPSVRFAALAARPGDPGPSGATPWRAAAPELRPARQAGAAPGQPLRPRAPEAARQARDQTLEDLPRPGVPGRPAQAGDPARGRRTL
jgi:Transposase domain (DUF772)